jgi:hypothetical protein
LRVCKDFFLLIKLIIYVCIDKYINYCFITHIILEIINGAIFEEGYEINDYNDYNYDYILF